MPIRKGKLWGMCHKCLNTFPRNSRFCKVCPKCIEKSRKEGKKKRSITISNTYNIKVYKLKTSQKDRKS